MRVKICGITNRDDALAAAELGADFVGLILAPSARQISIVQAADIMRDLPAATKPVLLFRDAPLGEVRAALDATRCDWVQLHGNEPVPYLRTLRDRYPALHLIKAWTITVEGGGALGTYLGEAADTGVAIEVVILDAPKGGPHPGYEALGQVATACTQRPPAVFCAGGLTADNVAAAVAQGEYDGVDVASGVEREPGVKDHAAVRAFIEAARGS